MLAPADVSACLVTRGDVDLTEVIAALPYDDVVVWDNSVREDMKAFGRYAAIAEAKHDVIFFVDDDFVFTHHRELLAAYEPGVVLANMSPGWVAQHDYVDNVMVGMGGLMDRTLWEEPVRRYRECYGETLDQYLGIYPEQIITTQLPIKRVDLPARVLPWGYAPNRSNALPEFETWKAEAIRRGRLLRDRYADAPAYAKETFRRCLS